MNNVRFSGIGGGNPLELSDDKGRFEDSLFEGIYDPNITRKSGLAPVQEMPELPTFKPEAHKNRFTILVVFCLCQILSSFSWF